MMKFECEILFGITQLPDEQDLRIRILSPTQVEILANDSRIYTIATMRKQIVAGLNQKLDAFVEEHLGKMALKEEAQNKAITEAQVVEKKKGK